MSQGEKETQDSKYPEEWCLSINTHGIPAAPTTKMVNDSNAQEVLEKEPQTQIITTQMSNRVHTQSSRQALMVSIKARRSFIKSMDSSSDMNPYLAVVIEDALMQMAQALRS